MSVGFCEGCFGRFKIDRNGNENFVPMGKEVVVTKVYEYLDDDKIELELEYEYNSRVRKIRVDRGKLGSPQHCEFFVSRGVDVRRSTFDCFCESISVKEEEAASNGDICFCHSKLGWCITSKFSEDGTPETVYRTDRIISADSRYKSRYRGQFKVTPMGSREAWLEMVKNDVLPSLNLKIVLLHAMSAVILGLLGNALPLMNGILHLCGASSTGKTTAGYLAASIAGQPFFSVKREADEIGNEVQKSSLLQGFSATNNALVLKQSGNMGVPIVLDELGKYSDKDLKDVIFSFADGEGKSRGNEKLEVVESKGFRTTILTIGEQSLIEKCDIKLDGLKARIFELTGKLTESAEQSQRIKQVCTENNGMIAATLAKHILKCGGAEYLKNLYESKLSEIKPKLSVSNSNLQDRYIETFPALYLTTAEIAKEAFGLDFAEDELMAFFAEYIADGGTDEISLTSYDDLIEEFRSNIGNFCCTDNSDETVNRGKIWGRYKKLTPKYSPFGIVVAEYAVYKSKAEELLHKHNHDKRRSIEIWKKKGLISYEKGKNTRSRKITSNQDVADVYVFNIYENGGECNDEA